MTSNSQLLRVWGIRVEFGVNGAQNEPVLTIHDEDNVGVRGFVQHFLPVISKRGRLDLNVRGFACE